MKKKINLNDSYPMRVKVFVDNEEIINTKSNSFLKNYIRLLHSFMNGGDVTDDIAAVRSPLATDNFDGSLFQVTAVSISSGKLRLTTASNHGASSGDYAYVMGVNTITGGPYLGWQEVTVISGNIIELTNTSGLSGTHNNTFSIPYVRIGVRTSASATRAASLSFAVTRIGVGTATTANTLATETLSDEVPTGVGLNTTRSMALSGSISIAEPTVGATTSTIEITQSFVNNSGISININEIGLWTKLDLTASRFRYITIARDVLPSTVTVNNGQTIQITYELITDVPTTDGGILIQWNELFYRQIAQLSRESKDIFNANSIQGPTAGQLYVNSKGGLNPLSDRQLSATSLSSYYVGPRVGSSTELVVNTNFRLQDNLGNNTAYAHGTSTNELYHYGAYITPLIDSGSDCYFQVRRVFENRSGADITINETGLYAAYTASAGYAAVHCLARHLVSPAIVIANNEYVAVTYEIRITV